jgi:uncharacterized repeat protein (TIGR03837 family)
LRRAAAAHRGALTVRVLPFVPQPDYDRLLWACDLNFVRGEDSFVRAQWAGRPFVWHIYPQDENLHHKKLRAFLQRYAGLDSLNASRCVEWRRAGAQGWDAADVGASCKARNAGTPAIAFGNGSGNATKTANWRQSAGICRVAASYDSGKLGYNARLVF